MKKHLSLCFAASAFIGNLAFATNPVQGPYFGVLAGASYLPETNYNGSLILLPGQTGRLSYHLGFNGGLQLGYKINNFRMEIEGDYVNFRLGQLKIGNLVIKNKNSNFLVLKGSNSLLSGYFNAYYDFYNPWSTWDFYPYVGVGLGYMHLRNNVKIKAIDIELIRTVSTENVFAGQAILGMGYYMDDYTTFGLEYRYGTSAPIQIFNNQRLQVHTVAIVFNFALAT